MPAAAYTDTWTCLNWHPRKFYDSLIWLFISMSSVWSGLKLVLFSGKLIRKLADAADHHKGLSKPHIALNLVGFGAGVIATMTSGIYAKWQVEERRRKEERTLGWLEKCVNGHGHGALPRRVFRLGISKGSKRCRFRKKEHWTCASLSVPPMVSVIRLWNRRSSLI